MSILCLDCTFVLNSFESLKGKGNIHPYIRDTSVPQTGVGDMYGIVGVAIMTCAHIDIPVWLIPWLVVELNLVLVGGGSNAISENVYIFSWRSVTETLHQRCLASID